MVRMFFLPLMNLWRLPHTRGDGPFACEEERKAFISHALLPLFRRLYEPDNALDTRQRLTNQFVRPTITGQIYSHSAVIEGQ